MPHDKIMNINLGLNQKSENSATLLAYNSLREKILTGELAPDRKLKIEELRKLLGVGASPIREALSLLTSDQLVVRQDQRGFRTALTSRENFQEILELRCEVEGIALRQSIEKLTDAWVEELVLAHHRMARSKNTVPEQFETLHKGFHMALINNCNSKLLVGFCSQLYDLNIRYRYIAARASGYSARNIGDEHKHILEAVISSSFEDANALLSSHYKTTGAFIETFI
ncbi:GntR family transcriptional regulator [Amylibacter sp.]|jgi:DNA-binding GntR family transcriptional regulator|nr:GntR family transcriptional regulator [Amylibacter sp.]MDB9804020.1 GntR family transcriptional regulator [Amylibacter sp.]|tara:strand:- start:269 stop:949 length:681 start_codon:yes stop_codon:yes gene_type:complete